MNIAADYQGVYFLTLKAAYEEDNGNNGYGLHIVAKVKETQS
jgi:hypothetical protein